MRSRRAETPAPSAALGEAAAYCMKYRDVEKLLTAHGFELIRQQGSHRHFQGFVDGKRCIVTLA